MPSATHAFVHWLAEVQLAGLSSRIHFVAGRQ